MSVEEAASRSSLRAQHGGERPIKVAVIGDSRATSYGCPEGVSAFPELIGSMSGGRLEVRNLARGLLLLDKFLQDPGELLAWQPDLVVSAFGGRESLYWLPRRIARIRCDPWAPLGGSGLLWPVAWLRQRIWRRIIRVLIADPERGERLMARLGARPYRTTDEYAASLEELITLVKATSATTLIMESFDSVIAQYPWHPRMKPANTDAARAAAARHPQRVLTWDPKAFVDFQGLFVGDGVHLTAHGHRVLATALSQQIMVALGAIA